MGSKINYPIFEKVAALPASRWPPVLPNAVERSIAPHKTPDEVLACFLYPILVLRRITSDLKTTIELPLIFPLTSTNTSLKVASPPL
jgi:hypothetical protein